MQLSQALDAIHHFSPENFSSLSSLLSPEMIEECLSESGTVTLRKRRLSMDMMVWAVVGMALYRQLPMSHIVSQLGILLPGDRPFVAPSAVVQARQRLGAEPIRAIFNKTQPETPSALLGFFFGLGSRQNAKRLKFLASNGVGD